MVARLEVPQTLPSDSRPQRLLFCKYPAPASPLFVILTDPSLCLSFHSNLQPLCFDIHAQPSSPNPFLLTFIQNAGGRIARPKRSQTGLSNQEIFILSLSFKRAKIISLISNSFRTLCAKRRGWQVYSNLKMAAEVAEAGEDDEFSGC